MPRHHDDAISLPAAADVSPHWLSYAAYFASQPDAALMLRHITFDD